MKLNKTVKINHPTFKGGKIACTYGHMWYNIPIYYTEEGSNVSSVLCKDGSCLIVVSRRISNIFNDDMMRVALWHEVSHLYYKDCLTTWKLDYEYRADRVAAYATSIKMVISSLELARTLYSNEDSLDILDKRERKILQTCDMMEVQPLQMLDSLIPVVVAY